MIAIVNYKMGNLQSIANAIKILGAEAEIAEKPEDLEKAEGIIIPGVGAFKDGMENLRKAGFIEALNNEVLEKKKPFLGICLGMQLIAKKSFEYGEHKGLGWVDFNVCRIEPSSPSFRIPHMGWNNLELRGDGGKLFKGIKEPAVVYFVHSYHLTPLSEADENAITSTCYHGAAITASLEKENIFGTQFHPEKSQNTGLTMLKNFIDLTKAPVC